MAKTYNENTFLFYIVNTTFIIIAFFIFVDKCVFISKSTLFTQR